MTFLSALPGCPKNVQKFDNIKLQWFWKVLTFYKEECSGLVMLQRRVSSSMRALISRENTQRNLKNCCFNPCALTAWGRASSCLGFADEIHHIHLIFFFLPDIPLCNGIADYLLPFFFLPPAVRLESLGAPHVVFLEPVLYCYCCGTFVS